MHHEHQGEAIAPLNADQAEGLRPAPFDAAERIEMLERHVRSLSRKCESLNRSRRIGTAIASGLALVIVCTGFAQKEDTITAQRILITDAEGKPRGVLGTMPSGTVGLALSSTKGGGRASLTLTKDGIADLNLGRLDKHSVILSVDPHTSPFVKIGTDENNYAVLRRTPDYGELRFVHDSKFVLHARHFKDQVSDVTVATHANELSLSSNQLGAKLKSSSNLGKFTIGELRPAIYGVETETMGGKTKKTIDFNDLK